MNTDHDQFLKMLPNAIYLDGNTFSILLKDFTKHQSSVGNNKMDTTEQAAKDYANNNWPEYRHKGLARICFIAGAEYQNKLQTTWIDFNYLSPAPGQEIFIVWPSGNYIPEYRILDEEKLKENWSGMRWIPVPIYK